MKKGELYQCKICKEWYFYPEEIQGDLVCWECKLEKRLRKGEVKKW